MPPQSKSMSSDMRANMGVLVAEHELILRCLQSRVPLLAESAMRSHIRAAADRWVMP